MLVVGGRGSTFISSQAANCQEWASRTLKVRLMILTGTKMPNTFPTQTVPVNVGVEESDWEPVFIWSHQVSDGAGKGAEHFDYICQAGALY